MPVDWLAKSFSVQSKAHPLLMLIYLTDSGGDVSISSLDSVQSTTVSFTMVTPFPELIKFVTLL